MASLHPRTRQLADSKVPALEVLLAEGIPEPLQAALESEEVAIGDCRPTQVTWHPGSSVTVRYQATLSGAGLDGSHSLVAAAGRIPTGALVVESDDFPVGVWRVPHDPKLTGLPAAIDPNRVRDLLADLGAPEPSVSTRLRAYRPGRRAVVEARGAHHSIFLKVVRGERVEQLHRHHLHLSPHLPIPETLGFSRELGIVALQTMPGMTLRETLDTPTSALPDPVDFLSCLRLLPSPASEQPPTPSAIDRFDELAGLLRRLLPEHSGRLDALGREIGEDPARDFVPVHGDFYEAQVMVGEGQMVGLLDIDTYGWGRPGDDLATMIGHLAVWQSLSSQPERVRAYGQKLLRLSDQLLNPGDLRRRIAAVALSLAPGPFRVLLPDWPEETERRIAMAERWAESARRVDKARRTDGARRIDKDSLIPSSQRSYLTQAG